MIQKYNSIQTDKDKCDDLVRKILSLRSRGFCMRCGRSPIQVSHIIPRRFSATRCLMENVQALCIWCHGYFTNHPKEFEIWVIKTIGEEGYRKLQSYAQTVTKIRWKDELERLRAILEYEKLSTA